MVMGRVDCVELTHYHPFSFPCKRGIEMFVPSWISQTVIQDDGKSCRVRILGYIGGTYIISSSFKRTYLLFRTLIELFSYAICLFMTYYISVDGGNYVYATIPLIICVFAVRGLIHVGQGGKNGGTK